MRISVFLNKMLDAIFLEMMIHECGASSWPIRNAHNQQPSTSSVQATPLAPAGALLLGPPGSGRRTCFLATENRLNEGDMIVKRPPKRPHLKKSHIPPIHRIHRKNERNPTLLDYFFAEVFFSPIQIISRNQITEVCPRWYAGQPFGTSWVAAIQRRRCAWHEPEWIDWIDIFRYVQWNHVYICIYI